MEYKILGEIRSPEDVKALDDRQIFELCNEARDCIIKTVAQNGGHLSSNLGAVELTVALHRVFNSPEDAIIFDVGHQSYTHKLLTGRFDRFSTIRTQDGISGFMRPDESEHDPFVTGHSSNSISAAYGIYRAKRIAGEKGTAVAVIGDGAMTGGMAYEALNNAGTCKGNFIVVLNDNEMSISKNVGAIARNFSKMRSRPRYHYFKFAISRLLLRIPFIGRPLFNALFKIKELVKSIVYRKNLFVHLGFNYLGPVDGHNVAAMESLFKIAKSYNTPTLVHVVTVKGKGYTPAEKNPNSYHGVSSFNAKTGELKPSVVTYSDIAGQTLCDLASNNTKICAITAAMKSGTGLTDFADRYRNRFFDVGIAEQHAVTFAGGLAKGGMIPFFAVYSSFLQRGFDQVVHDCAIAGLPVKLLVDRAGIVGEDGESHQGIFDVAFLRSIPKINVYSPCFYDELSSLIKSTAASDELCAIRYPRGCENKNYSGDISGDYTIVDKGGSKALVTYGRLFSNAVDAMGDKDIDIIKLNKIYPVGNEVIEKLSSYREIHFFEEGIKSGGIAEHIGERLIENGFVGKYTVHAIDSEFTPSAKTEASLKRYGLDSESMAAAFVE